MNNEARQDLQDLVSKEMADRMKFQREYAEQFIHQVAEKMIDEGQAYELTEDEERMLKAYRRFRSTHAAGQFRWNPPPANPAKPEIVTPAEPSFIVDPSDASV